MGMARFHLDQLPLIFLPFVLFQSIILIVIIFAFNLTNEQPGPK